MFDDLLPNHTGQFAAGMLAFILLLAVGRNLLRLRLRENRTWSRIWYTVRLASALGCAIYAMVGLVRFPTRLGSHLGITVTMLLASAVIVWVVFGVALGTLWDRLLLRSVSVPTVMFLWSMFAASLHVLFTMLSYALHEHRFVVLFELTARDCVILLGILSALGYVAGWAPRARYHDEK